MNKLVLMLLLAALGGAGWWAFDRYLAPRDAYDGQGNHYRLVIDAESRMATVEADLWQSSNMLSMFDVQAVPGLPNGHIDLVEDLEVRDVDGDGLWLRDLGHGDYEIRGGQRIHLRYRVRLEHDRYAWPAGTEEVGYWTAEGLMIGGSRLFFADGEQLMQGDIEVAVELPKDWQAYTPWQPAAQPNRFAPASRRDLLSNVMFFGRIHREVVQAAGVELTLLLGQRYVAAAPMFRELLTSQLLSYRELFGAEPLSKRYLIIINEGASGDGGAFSSSFSQYIRGDADTINRVNWGYVMAHELLHFWNGLSLVPADHQEEWFKEGATDYLTIMTLARNGWIDESLLMKRLENVPRRYLMARALQRLDMSVRESGRDKQPNRLLVYGGGSLASMALDIEMRRRSNDAVGLPDLMAALFREYGVAGKTYQLADIERLAGELSGSDFRAFFAESVEGNGFFDIAPHLSEAGLRMDSFVEEIYIQRDPAADNVRRDRLARMFGTAVRVETDAAAGPMPAG